MTIKDFVNVMRRFILSNTEYGFIESVLEKEDKLEITLSSGEIFCMLFFKV